MSNVELGSVAEISRRLKRDLVRTWKEGMPEEQVDLIPMAMAVRNGDVVAQVMAPPGPMGPRYAVKAAAFFFRAEEVWSLADSIMWHGKPTERDMDAIKPGELVDNWREGKRDKLTECIMAVRMPKEGEATAQQWAYKRDGNKLRWEPPIDFGVFTGALLDYARDGWEGAPERWPELEALFLHAAEETDMAGADRDEILDRGAAVFASQVLHSSISLLLPQLPEEPPLVYADGERVEVVVLGG